MEGLSFSRDFNNLSRIGVAFCYLTVVVIFTSLQGCNGAKFLLPATSFFSMPSHYIGMTTITQKLVERGHDVTLLTIDKRKTKGFQPNSYTSNITYPNPKSEEEIAKFYKIKSTGMMAMSNSTLLEMMRSPDIASTIEMMYFGCFELFKNEDTLAQLKQERFDYVLTIPVTDFCDAVIAAYLDIPFIFLTGTRRSPVFTEAMLGIPIPLSYVPFSKFKPDLTDSMTFLQRVQNVFYRYVVHGVMEYLSVYRPIAQLQALHDIRPDLTPADIISRCALWLCHNTWALEYPRPTAPNWIPIPGYTIKEPKSLPEDLNAFVEGSGEHGFIIFTLGSMTVSFSKDAVADMVSKVFSELPQRVVWRYAGHIPRYLGNNTRIADWLPQNDLLAHPKARLLIYHAGSAGVHEAINHGVPMLLMPLGGDQPVNAHLVAAKGMGLKLDVNRLDEEVFRRALHTVLNNDSYKANTVKASSILRDRMASPLNTAVFWIEHVVKFGGDHLRLRAIDMGFIELHSLDVVAFLVVLCILCMYASFTIIKKCCRLVVVRKHKPKKD